MYRKTTVRQPDNMLDGRAMHSILKIKKQKFNIKMITTMQCVSQPHLSGNRSLHANGDNVTHYKEYKVMSYMYPLKVKKTMQFDAAFVAIITWLHGYRES